MCLFFVQLRQVVMRSRMSAGFAQAQGNPSQLQRNQSPAQRNPNQPSAKSGKPSLKGYHQRARIPDAFSPRGMGFDLANRIALARILFFGRNYTRAPFARGFVDPAPALSGGGAGAWTSVTKRRKDWPRLSGVAEPRDASRESARPAGVRPAQARTGKSEWRRRQARSQLTGSSAQALRKWSFPR